MERFTTKTTKATGRYKSFFSDSHAIKHNKKVIGSISGTGHPLQTAPYKIKLQVIKSDLNKNNNSNCEWECITLKARFDSVDEAKEWIKKPAIAEAILAKYNIYHDTE